MQKLSDIGAGAEVKFPRLDDSEDENLCKSTQDDSELIKNQANQPKPALESESESSSSSSDDEEDLKLRDLICEEIRGTDLS